MTVLLEAALAYARRGWSVVPIVPRAKSPLVPWVDYESRCASEAEIQAWWKKWPNANVGIITGKVSGLVVVDVDPKRGGNLDEELAKAPSGLVARTGSGGGHIFYRYPGNVPNVPCSVGQHGVDVRADGGLVVASPSVHETGRLYRWQSQGPAGPAPVWSLVDESQPRHDRNANGGNWIGQLLEQGAPDGTRNVSCSQLAGYFFGKLIPQDIAVNLILTWDGKNRPPLGRDEVERTVASTYRTATRRTEAEQKADQRYSTPDLMDSSPFGLMNFGKYMAAYADARTEWLVDEWMPEATIAFLISPPGSYKTWTILDLCVSVAAGVPLFGKFKVNNPGPVMLIQQEDYHGQTVQRLGVIVNKKLGLSVVNDGDDMTLTIPPEIPLFVHPDRKLRFDDPKIMQNLAEQIERYRPKLVVLDPLYSAGSTEDYMAKTAEQMFVLKTMRDRFKTSFLIAHHTKKSTEGHARENLWGSQFLNAFLETGWQVRLEDTTSIRVRRHYKSGASQEDVLVKFNIDTEEEFDYGVTVSQAPLVESNANVLDIIAGAKEPLTVAQMANLSGTHRTTIARKVTKLVKEGKIKKDGTGYVLDKTPDF